MSQVEDLFGQVVAEASVEAQALVQLHARRATRRGEAADPQVARSCREIVRLLGDGRRYLRVIEDKAKATSGLPDAA